MTYTRPEQTPRKRGPNQSKEDYKIYYDNFWAERDVKTPPATSYMMSNGRGIDVDEIGECYYADNGEPTDKLKEPSCFDVYIEHQGQAPHWVLGIIFLLIDWIEGRQKRGQTLPDDPLGFVGEWVSTRYAMGAGDFRYGSTFYIKSFNKMKQCYIVTCAPMGKTEIGLSVQTLIDFEASPRDGKRKTNGEQMTTLSELFDGYEEENEPCKKSQ